MPQENKTEYSQEDIEKLKSRFLSKFKINDVNGCWEWQKCKSVGYGRIYFKGKPCWAHRLSWIIHNGDIPKGLHICHKCDNKKCVNPNHMFLGTHRDNILDGMAKGIIKPIDSRKLSETEVLQIVELLKTDISVPEIANRFCVKKRQIFKILNGESWAKLTGLTLDSELLKYRKARRKEQLIREMKARHAKRTPNQS